MNKTSKRNLTICRLQNCNSKSAKRCSTSLCQRHCQLLYGTFNITTKCSWHKINAPSSPVEPNVPLFKQLANIAQEIQPAIDINEQRNLSTREVLQVATGSRRAKINAAFFLSNIANSTSKKTKVVAHSQQKTNKQAKKATKRKPKQPTVTKKVDEAEQLPKVSRKKRKLKAVEGDIAIPSKIGAGRRIKALEKQLQEKQLLIDSLTLEVQDAQTRARAIMKAFVTLQNSQQASPELRLFEDTTLSNAECALCMLSDVGTEFALQCGHKFHLECIIKCVAKRCLAEQCPHCLSPITLADKERISQLAKQHKVTDVALINSIASL